MLLILLCKYFVKASINNNPQDCDNLDLSEEKNSSLDEMYVDFSHVPLKGFKDPLLGEYFEDSLSEDEVIDYTKTFCITEQQNLIEDITYDVLDGFCLKKLFGEDNEEKFTTQN